MIKFGWGQLGWSDSVLQSADWIVFEFLSFGFNPGLEVCLWVLGKVRRFNVEQGE